MNPTAFPRHGSLLAAALAVSLGCDDHLSTPQIDPIRTGPLATQCAPIPTDGPTAAFADLEVFFEFNSTDHDLGFHVALDAVGWDRVQGTDPAGTTILDLTAQGELASLGVTQLLIESAEPSPEEVLARFAAGQYSFLGRTVEQPARLEGVAMLSTDIPPAPVFTPGDDDVVDPATTVISWEPIPGMVGYEIIVGSEDSGLSMSVEMGPSATSLPIPAEFMERGAVYKAEILAISPNGNKTITEHTFTTMR